MPGLSKVIVLDADVRASRQVQLGFERESVPTVVIPADSTHALPAEDAGLVVIGGADGQALELVRQTRAWRDARHLDAPILFASRGVRRTDAEAAGADEVVVQPVFLRDLVTLGRMLRGLRSEQRTRLVGSLVDVAGVFPLVRALAGLGRSATLTLIRGLRRGEIRFYHGEVTSAQVGMIHGQAALHQLLLWTDARFDFHHEDVVRRQQIPLSHDELFADAEHFLESVRDASGGLSPAIVLEQDVERLKALGKQIPTEVYGVLRLFDGYRVLADALEDSPYRVFETLRVAQRAVEAGLLRVVDKEPPRPTWRAILGIEEWLVGGEPPASAADASADADAEPVATPTSARITERGPSMDARKAARKPRRKKKRREGTPPVARATSQVAAPPPPAPPAAIDWGALVPRVVGAEVGSLAGAVPAAHVSGEITASAKRPTAAAADQQPTVVLDDETDDARETPHLLAAILPDEVAHLAPQSTVQPAVAPHDIAHFAPASGLGPAVEPHDIAHFAPPSGLGPAVAPHDIAHFAPPSGLGPAVAPDTVATDELELAPIPRVRRGPGALDRSRREAEPDDRAAETTDVDGATPVDEAAWAAHALVRATAEALARAEAALGERRAAQRLATETAVVATTDAETKSVAATRARADAATRAEQAALAQAAAHQRREAERLAVEAAARAEADARASAEAAAQAEADARAKAEASEQATAAARVSAEAAAQAEADARAKAEASEQADADARAKVEAAADATAIARASADAAAQAEADARAMANAAAEADAEARARAEAATHTEVEARTMAEVAARAEADARARSEEAARAEADARAKTEAAVRADADADAKAAAAAQADADACVIAELAAAAEAIAREQREAEHLAAEAAARAEHEMRALTDALARAESDAHTLTEALAVAAAEAFGDAMDRTQTDAPAASQVAPPPPSTVPTEPMSVPTDPLIAAVYDAEIDADEDEQVTSPGFRAARSTIRGLAVPRVGERDADTGPRDAGPRDAGPRDASPPSADERDLDERDTKPFAAQSRPTDPREPQPAAHRATVRGVVAPRPAGGIGAHRATERGFAAAPGSTAAPDDASPFDANTPVDSTPSAILDEPSDGIVRQHITTADTAPVKRRRLPSDPPEDDRPGAAMGEITASTRARTEPRYSEPTILVADLFADGPAVPDAVTDAASNEATAPVVQSPPIAPAPSNASEPDVSAPIERAPVDAAPAPLAQAPTPDPHAPGSTQPAASAHAKRPQTHRSNPAAQESAPRREKRPSEPRREVAFSEAEEAFFRAGHDKEAPVPTAPPPESFDDLDEGYRPVGFWDRLRGRAARRRRKSTGPVKPVDSNKPNKPAKR